MKRMALRVDSLGNKSDLDDIVNLADVVGLGTKDDLLKIATEFYPEAQVSAKLHLALDGLWKAIEEWRKESRHEPPRYLG